MHIYKELSWEFQKNFKAGVQHWYLTTCITLPGRKGDNQNTPYTLVGPTVTKRVQDPLAVNTSTTDYI